MTSTQEVLAWEERWSRPAGVATLLAIVFLIAWLIVGSQISSGSGTAEQLIEVNEHPGTQILANVLAALGFALLIAPLYFLFRAARARSDRVRRQLVGVVIVGPLFFAAASLVLGFASVDGAERFVEDKVPALETESVKLDSEKADEKAEDTVSEGTLASLGVGLKFGGLIGFVAGFLYTALWAMRVGLLTRFWGSLGVALAAVSVFFLQFALLWFVYVALLLLGLVRGGRPPAWESGKAEPWPTPGERAAAAIEKGSAAGLPSSAEGDERQDDGSPNNGEPPRKRKQRG